MLVEQIRLTCHLIESQDSELLNDEKSTHLQESELLIQSDAPKIAILCWEEGQVPVGLQQLECLIGNSTNPASYKFPVRLHRVRGANVHTILEHPSQTVLRTMIADARAMASEGIRAITTSCGFNAIFQRELAEAAGIPVITSSLLQVPFARHICGPTAGICILTANAGALSQKHLESVGIASMDGLQVVGLEQCAEWNRMFAEPFANINLDLIQQEVLGTVLRVVNEHPGIRAFVLECTDLPPYSIAIRQMTGLPVLDFITMVNYLHSTI